VQHPDLRKLRVEWRRERARQRGNIVTRSFPPLPSRTTICP
jgi:hypothetical protein